MMWKLKSYNKNIEIKEKRVSFHVKVKRSNPFLTNLKKDINKISEQKDMIIPADKTTNNYLVPPVRYLSMIDKEIQKKKEKKEKKFHEKLQQ